MKESKQGSIKGTRRRKPGAGEMLEVPPEWSEVPDWMMEEEDVLPEATGSAKQRRDEFSEGGENGERKMTSGLRNVTFAQSISENTKSRGILCLSNGKHQISGRESHRWCFS